MTAVNSLDRLGMLSSLLLKNVPLGTHDALPMPGLFQELHAPAPTVRCRAAILIGHEKPPGSAAALLDRLEEETDADVFCGCCAALELLGDVSAVPGLRKLLARCADENVWSVTHALRTLTGVDPFVPFVSGAGIKRRCWLKALDGWDDGRSTPRGLFDHLRAMIARQPPRQGAVVDPPRSVIEPRVLDVYADAEFLRFGIDHGRSRIRIDYPPPPPGRERLVRWNRALFVAGQPFHDLGSTCPTCEAVMFHLGWPPERAATVSRAMAEELRRGAVLSPSVIRRWSPLLGELPSGNYLVATLKLRVERISEERQSWWYLREYDREDFSEPYEFDANYAHHYQGPNFPFDEIGKTYWMVMPSQNPQTLNESCVAEYVDLIGSGSRPTILTLGWMDRRYTQTKWPECFLTLFVLDGHHKLEAYARCKMPAHLIGLFRLEDSWGDPNDRSQHLIEMIRQHQTESGTMASESYWHHLDWLD